MEELTITPYERPENADDWFRPPVEDLSNFQSWHRPGGIRFVRQQHTIRAVTNRIVVRVVRAPRRPESATLERTFQEMVERWRSETRFTSSIEKLAMHPSYQRIIGLGEPAVPLLLRELRIRPDHWFWALGAITGANPVRPEDEGALNRMAEAWLTWGREHHYS